MAKNLASLSLEALDNAERLHILQDILTICLEEIGNPSEGTLKRIELLLDLYLPHAQCRLDDLEFNLREINNLAVGKGV